MFAVCFLIGCVTFYNLRLSEYVAFVSAAVATLTELWYDNLDIILDLVHFGQPALIPRAQAHNAPTTRSKPSDFVLILRICRTFSTARSEDHLNLNDNLTIPLFSSVALAWAMARVEVCTAV